MPSHRLFIVYRAEIPAAMLVIWDFGGGVPSRPYGVESRTRRDRDSGLSGELRLPLSV